MNIFYIIGVVVVVIVVTGYRSAPLMNEIAERLGRGEPAPRTARMTPRRARISPCPRYTGHTA